MRLRVFSILSLGIVLALCLTWVGCSDGTGSPGAGGALISPSLDTTFTIEETLPDNAWEQYVELHYGNDEQAGDAGWSQSDQIGPDDGSQASDGDDPDNPKNTKPTF